MWWAAAQAGLAVVGGIASSRASNKQAHSQRAWRDYQNKMTVLSSLEDQNTVSLNEDRARRQQVSRLQEIQVNELRAKGEARVAAAAAGVSGQSVAKQATDIARNSANQQDVAIQNYQTQLVDFDQQRKTIKRRAEAGQDIAGISGQSSGETLMGIGGQLINIGSDYYGG